MVDQALSGWATASRPSPSTCSTSPSTQPFDAILSTATFHWIERPRASSSQRLSSPHSGREVELDGAVRRCRSIANVQAAIDAVDHPAPAGLWPGPWNFAGPRGQTTKRLTAAGFAGMWTWLQPWPVDPPDPREYFSTVILGSHLERLPRGRARAVRYGLCSPSWTSRCARTTCG